MFKQNWKTKKDHFGQIFSLVVGSHRIAIHGE